MKRPLPVDKHHYFWVNNGRYPWVTEDKKSAQFERFFQIANQIKFILFCQRLWRSAHR